MAFGLPVISDVSNFFSRIRGLSLQICLKVYVLALTGCTASLPETVHVTPEVSGLVLSQNDGDLYRVFIEGDGRAFDAEGHVRSDPTPHRAIGLRIAQSDCFAARIYLARPCQYTLQSDACKDMSIWSAARFDEAAINLLDEALGHLKTELRVKSFEIVGYSGGGVVAIQLLARRDDIASVTTLGAPLDLSSWTQHHQISSVGSDVEILHLIETSQTPLNLLFGHLDRIVPPVTLSRVKENCLANPHCQFAIEPSVNHTAWRQLWKRNPASGCRVD